MLVKINFKQSRFTQLTKTLSPCAHMFFLVVWNMWRLVGSVDTWPTQRRRVPITNILTTTPIRVYSMNHRLQDNNNSAIKPPQCVSIVIIQPIIPRYFYTVIFSSLCHFLSILLVTVVYMYVFFVHERIASSMSTNIFEAFLQDCDHWCLRVSTLSRLIFE